MEGSGSVQNNYGSGTGRLKKCGGSGNTSLFNMFPYTTAIKETCLLRNVWNLLWINLGELNERVDGSFLKLSLLLQQFRDFIWNRNQVGKNDPNSQVSVLKCCTGMFSFEG
jgi:hypothetical protein